MQPTAGFITRVTCRLTAKNRDQLRNPTLGNRVWVTFTFFNPAAPCQSLTVEMTADGYRSIYDVTSLPRQSFDNVELVVASCTTSPASVRGTIALVTHAAATSDLKQTLHSPVKRRHGFNRYNVTAYFDNIRRRLSPIDHQHRFGQIRPSSRYYTIRDVISTCARKPTRVSFIYCTETTTKKCRT